MTQVEINKTKAHFNSLSAQEQWQWLVDTPLKNEFTVFLDNDYTGLNFLDDTDESLEAMTEFKSCIGWDIAVVYLLKAIGVESQKA